MRRIARTQQRKRQTWLALPASGIEEVGHGCRAERTISKDCGEAKDSRRHEITISENVSAKLQLAYNREALRICNDE